MNKIILVMLIIISYINAKTMNDFMYEKCMESDIKKRSIITEEEKKEMEKKRTKEEILKEKIEEEKMITQKILDITIIETNTTKTLIINNKSYCSVELIPKTFINEELKKLKDFREIINIKEHEEIKITKIK